MKVTVLGYWGAFPWQGDGTSSYLLEADGFSLLLDAGSSTLNVLQEQLDPLVLDAVILSHYHHDHIADLGVLQYYRQLKATEQQVVALPIYAHTEDAYHFAALTMTGVSKGVPYTEGQRLEIGPFNITLIRTVHPVPCFAMRIEERNTGKVLLYSADTGYFEGFQTFINGADLLIADTYLLAGQENHHAHLTSKEVGQLAQRGAIKKLVLSHLQPDSDLQLLLKQAQEAAGEEVEVVLAHKVLSMTI